MEDPSSKSLETRAAEYAEQLRKYKQIENDMRAYNEQILNNSKKQQGEVSRLELENYELLDDLQIHETHLAKQNKQMGIVQKEVDSQNKEI